jgi:HD-like signal output (HDOD) protein
MDRAKEILAKVKTIRPLPTAASRLLTLAAKPEVALREIAKIVETDAVLTASLLRAVNSASVGLRQPVASVARAIDLTGTNLAVSLAMKECAKSVFDQPLRGYGSERGELWRHSLRAAIGSREVSKFARGDVPSDIAYTAGLLVDIGKTVISEYLEAKPDEFVDWIETGECKDFLEAERRKLGTDHCEIGAVMAQSWGLPEILTVPIRYHHRPHEAPEAFRHLVYVVHLGDTVAMMEGDAGYDQMKYIVDADCQDVVGPMKPMQLEKLMADVHFEYMKFTEALESTVPAGT